MDKPAHPAEWLFFFLGKLNISVFQGEFSSSILCCRDTLCLLALLELGEN